MKVELENEARIKIQRFVKSFLERRLKERKMQLDRTGKKGKKGKARKSTLAKGTLATTIRNTVQNTAGSSTRVAAMMQPRVSNRRITTQNTLSSSPTKVGPRH